MLLRRSALALPLALVLVAAGCASSPDGSDEPAPSSSSAVHGEVAGAQEVAEPPLGLVSIDADGRVGTLDLLDGATSDVGEVGEPWDSATDGRYVFVTTDDGIEIVDGGAWTWDHADHFHYYRAEPAIVGGVQGQGPAVVATGPLSTAAGTGVFFAGSGEAVLLDNEALSNGEVVESFRVETGASHGLVAPLGTGAVVTEADDGVVHGLRFHDSDGLPSAEGAVECAEAEGAVTTRVGLVVGCADGAVLATMDRGEPVFERIPYPADADAERATSFDARKGRPTVAALAGDDGFWLLDTRERTWRLVETSVPLVRVVAVDDADGHVVALDGEGRVRVLLAETGDEVAVTDQLLPQTIADDDLLAGVSLFVDAQRAYLNAPAEGVVLEIAYADGARIARTLETPTVPVFLAEVGR